MKYFLIKILQDNYIWGIADNRNNAVIIDCGESTKTLNFLYETRLNLTHILVTHHHYDHTDGLLEVQKCTSAKIVTSYKTANLLSNKLNINKILNDNTKLRLNDFEFNVLFTAGHTKDSVCFFETNNKWLFSGDTLFSLGCGRAFECNPSVLFESLSKLKNLPPDTLVFAGHEYTKSNLKFVNSLNFFDTKELNILLSKKEVTLPVTLEHELKYNPFLNANNNKFKEFMNCSNLSNTEFFTYLRNLKDNF